MQDSRGRRRPPPVTLYPVLANAFGHQKFQERYVLKTNFITNKMCNIS